MIDFKNKKVVVLGLGISGLASAKLLQSLGASVFVSEKDNSPKQTKFCAELDSLSIPYELGFHSQKKIQDADYIVLSPGIPLSAQPVAWAKEKNIPIMSEMELGFQQCPATIIAITGTNGKTTVTTLIGHVLEESGKKTFTLGNIGEPLSSKVREMKRGDFVSLEVSSFQLETIHEFHPKVSVILNLTPDHLDRYASVREYLDAKKLIYKNQTKDDFVVLNYRDPVLRQLGKEMTNTKVVFFAGEDSLSDNKSYNENQLAVMKVAEVLGINRDVCKRVFARFRGIEHRMEFVRELDGVEFINDSKGTNTDSTVWGLRNTFKPVILLAGGKDKGCDYASVLPLLQDKVKLLILFGQAKNIIRNALPTFSSIQEAKDLHDAVTIAFQHARAGDCVLLSPMCASFDMFANYKERGKIFKDIVLALKSRSTQGVAETKKV